MKLQNDDEAGEAGGRGGGTKNVCGMVEKNTDSFEVFLVQQQTSNHAHRVYDAVLCAMEKR